MDRFSFLFTTELLRGRTRLRMKPWLTGVMLLLLSGFITLFSLWLQPTSFLGTIRFFLQQPLLIILNWFPALVLTALLYFLTNNLFWGSAISGGALWLLSYINLLKIEGREDPLVPSDIMLFREALNAVEEYQLEMHWSSLFIMAALAAAAAVLGCFIKSPSLRLPWRLGWAALSVVIFLSTVRLVYQNKTLYSELSGPYAYNIASVFNTLGFNYCFLYNYDLYPVDKPEGFSKSEVEDWIDASSAAGEMPDIKPNVIMVMCEAFTDLSAAEMFAYSEETDPLRDYYTVANSSRAYSGHLVVSNYGAGTANTEFNILTGMQTNMIGEGTTSSFRVVRKETASIASLLAENGYHTFFMHPGESWFYNRTSVYDHLGISDQVFVEAFDESDYKGTMISDEAFLDELKADLQTRLVEAEQPLFTYTVTIQNHQSYTYDKYPDRPEAVPLNVTVSEGTMETLSVYMEGIRDSSAMLLELTEYLDSIDEPTLLVFFGDHRPNIGQADAELGLTFNTGSTPEEIIDSYTTPYVLWANQAYADAIDISAAYAALDLPENGLISDNYLGAAVLQLLGCTGQDPFFDFLNELRLELPVLRTRERAYCLADGSYTTSLSDPQQSLVEQLSKWTYYKLKY